MKWKGQIQLSPSTPQSNSTPSLTPSRQGPSPKSKDPGGPISKNRICALLSIRHLKKHFRWHRRMGPQAYSLALKMAGPAIMWLSTKAKLRGQKSFLKKTMICLTSNSFRCLSYPRKKIKHNTWTPRTKFPKICLCLASQMWAQVSKCKWANKSKARQSNSWAKFKA